MGLVIIPWGSGTGIATLFGSGNRYRDKSLEDLPSLKNKNFGEGVSVSSAYKDLESGRYHAYISDRWSGDNTWLRADTLSELQEKVEKEVPRLKEKSRKYRSQRGIH